jgi:hypothetical protein
MTQQEHIERNLRMLIGELQVQIIVANARISELLEEAEQRDMDKQSGPELPPKYNGKVKEARADGDPGPRP